MCAWYGVHDDESGALVGDVSNLSLEIVCPIWPVGDLGSSFRGEAMVRFLKTGDPGRERVELPPL